MGQVLHGSATTTHAIRAAIQRSKAPIQELAQRYGLNRKTVMKWRKRAFVSDAAMGPKEPRSSTLSREHEAIAIAFRRHTLLPLDDCLYALQATIPGLTRSSLHRLFQRHAISRLPEIEGEKTSKKRFKPTAIGFFHIDIAEVRTEAGKLHLFVAIDRTSKFAFAQLHDRTSRRIAADFLRALIAVVPYTIHIVLTDNGTQFTELANYRRSIAGTEMKDEPDEPGRIYRIHAFDYACQQNNIEHRLTKPNHPWTNGQVERMNRTLKEATVRAYHYENQQQLQAHLAAFLDAYNFAKRLKTLRGFTPYEAVCDAWAKTPQRFRLPPDHLMSGLNT